MADEAVLPDTVALLFIIKVSPSPKRTRRRTSTAPGTAGSGYKHRAPRFPFECDVWVKNGDDSFEVLDGQQRTLSICEYVANNFSIAYKNFGTLPEDRQKQILDYELMVYFCEGTDFEKLEWFEIVNLAGGSIDSAGNTERTRNGFSSFFFHEDIGIGVFFRHLQKIGMQNPTALMFDWRKL